MWHAWCRTSDGPLVLAQHTHIFKIFECIIQYCIYELSICLWHRKMGKPEEKEKTKALDGGAICKGVCTLSLALV
jgi:hypothetical protein